MGSSEDLDYFNNTIENALKESDRTTITASKLAKFPFKKLCFERIDFLIWNNYIKLSFHTVDDEVVLKLDYDDYYLHDNYVPGSLDGQCVHSNEYFVILRRYASPKPIEFCKENNLSPYGAMAKAISALRQTNSQIKIDISELVKEHIPIGSSIGIAQSTLKINGIYYLVPDESGQDNHHYNEVYVGTIDTREPVGIGPGDIIEITIWFNKGKVINVSGTITYMH
jgi:hypothetical protein